MLIKKLPWIYLFTRISKISAISCAVCNTEDTINSELNNDDCLNFHLKFASEYYDEDKNELSRNNLNELNNLHDRESEAESQTQGINFQSRTYPFKFEYDCDYCELNLKFCKNCGDNYSVKSVSRNCRKKTSEFSLGDLFNGQNQCEADEADNQISLKCNTHDLCNEFSNKYERTNERSCFYKENMKKSVVYTEQGTLADLPTKFDLKSFTSSENPMLNFGNRIIWWLLKIAPYYGFYSIPNYKTKISNCDQYPIRARLYNCVYKLDYNVYEEIIDWVGLIFTSFLLVSFLIDFCLGFKLVNLPEWPS